MQTISNDRLQTVLTKFNANKVIDGDVSWVYLTSADLAAMSTADANYFYYGKMSVTADLNAALEVYWDTTRTLGLTSAATLYNVASINCQFDDVVFNKIILNAVGLNPASVWFTGVKVKIRNK